MQYFRLSINCLKNSIYKLYPIQINSKGSYYSLINRNTQLFPLSNFHTTTSHDNSEEDDDDDGICEIHTNNPTGYNLKNLETISNHSTNEITDIPEFSTSEEVLNYVEKSLKENTFSPSIAALVTIKLNDLQKQSSKYKHLKLKMNQKIILNESYAWPYVLQNLSNYSCCSVATALTLIISLFRLGCSISNDSIQNLLYNTCYPNISEFKLTELTQFSLGFNKYKIKYIMHSVLLQPFLEKVQQVTSELSQLEYVDENDFKQLSIIFFNYGNYVSANLLEKFTIITSRYLDNESQDVKTLLRCFSIMIACCKEKDDVEIQEEEKFQRYNDLQQFLLDKIHPFISEMKTEDLTFFTQKVFISSCNMNEIHKAITKRALCLLGQFENDPNDNYFAFEECDLILCLSLSGQLSLSEKNLLQPKLDQHLNEVTLKYNSNKICNIIQNLPVTNFKVLDKAFTLYSKLENLQTRFEITLIKLYLHIRSTSKYRHRELENMLTEKLMHYLENFHGLLPHLGACYSSFLIANSVNKMPSHLFDKILSHVKQFNYNEIGLISKCYKLSLENQTFVSGSTIKFLNSLREGVLQYSRDSNSTHTNLYYVHSMMNSLKNILPKRDLFESEELDTLLDKYNTNSNLSGRHIRNCAKNLNFLSIFLPHIADSIAENISKKPNQSIVNIRMFLWYLFNCGYLPEVHEDFMSFSNRELRKNHQALSGLHLLQSCLALGLFQGLEQKTAKMVFNTEFIEKLEEEHSDENSNPRHLATVKRLLLELNRVVCIDYPEFNIPWFHERYCQSQVYQSTHRMTALKIQVFETLHEVLGGTQYCRAFHYTPYYILLDFECFLNNQNCALPCSDYGSVSWGSDTESDKLHAKYGNVLPTGFSRVAVNVLSNEHFCNNVPRLKGAERLKQRQQEMLGYKVVQVPHFEWNSLQLSQPKAKQNYLRLKLFN